LFRLDRFRARIHYAVSELKAPDCVQDVSSAFFSQNDQQTEPIHPVLPVSNFYLLVRYVGDNAIAAAPSFDFSRFPDTYGDPSIRGWPLTNLAVPDPKSAWQRASRLDATTANSSAFQVHCYDAASFINTWTFPQRSIRWGSPHAIYGYTQENLTCPGQASISGRDTRKRGICDPRS
jgi:hypothetical protein